MVHESEEKHGFNVELRSRFSAKISSLVYCFNRREYTRNGLDFFLNYLIPATSTINMTILENDALPLDDINDPLFRYRVMIDPCRYISKVHMYVDVELVDINWPCIIAKYA